MPQILSHAELKVFFRQILNPDRSFYALALVYTIAISLLTLAVPISVQTLIGSVANTALVQPVVVLSLMLLVLLLFSGVLYALRQYVMELFRRRIYSRLNAEIVLRALNADSLFFDTADRRALFSRYFDIMTLQKTVPSLLVGGFSLALQSLVGFIVVSLYHPIFLVMNIAFVLLVWLIWRVWSPRAVQSSMALSHKKYAMADWLSELSGHHHLYRSRHGYDYALTQTETKTQNYVQVHAQHFRQVFSQSIALLLLYAFASSTLLGLGGWLVIIGELSLGQLVAAELIMTAIFLGFAQANQYLDTYYDLCAGIEELSLLMRIPHHQHEGQQGLNQKSGQLSVKGVRTSLRQHEVHFDIEIPHQALVSAQADRRLLQRLFEQCLQGDQHISGGQIILGDQDLNDIELTTLRTAIQSIDHADVMPVTIAEYLQRCSEAQHAEAPNRRMQRELLSLVGVAEVIDRLEAGWNTPLQSNGLPLSTAETIKLKLVACLLSRPKVLIWSQALDVIDSGSLHRLLSYCRQQDWCPTMISFSRHQLPIWSHHLHISEQQQTLKVLNGALDHG